MNALWAGLCIAFPFFIASAQTRLERAVITQVEGKAFVGESAASRSITLSDDSLLRAEAGRIAVRLRGGMLYLGENSSVRVIDNRPYNFNRLEVLRGSAIVQTGPMIGVAVCESEVSLSDSGVFRFDLVEGSPGENHCHVRVYKGAASAQLDTVAAVLRTSEEINLNRKCGDRVAPAEFKVAELDSLDR